MSQQSDSDICSFCEQLQNGTIDNNLVYPENVVELIITYKADETTHKSISCSDTYDGTQRYYTTKQKYKLLNLFKQSDIDINHKININNKLLQSFYNKAYQPCQKGDATNRCGRGTNYIITNALVLFKNGQNTL